MMTKKEKFLKVTTSLSSATMLLTACAQPGTNGAIPQGPNTQKTLPTNRGSAAADDASSKDSDQKDHTTGKTSAEKRAKEAAATLAQHGLNTTDDRHDTGKEPKGAGDKGETDAKKDNDAAVIADTDRETGRSTADTELDGDLVGIKLATVAYTKKAPKTMGFLTFHNEDKTDPYYTFETNLDVNVKSTYSCDFRFSLPVQPLSGSTTGTSAELGFTIAGFSLKNSGRIIPFKINDLTSNDMRRYVFSESKPTSSVNQPYLIVADEYRPLANDSIEFDLTKPQDIKVLSIKCKILP